MGIAPGITLVDWTTAYAVLLWASLPGFEAERTRAVEHLLQIKGVAVPKSPDDPVGHDTTIVGWPWVPNTHSWLEPTAMAVLALRRAGQLAHPRVQEGLSLIRDRAIRSGGWNYGNTSIFGNTLRAHPGPTGQALLALAGVDGGGPIVDAALAFLGTVLPHTRAPSSLGWGLLGMTAWGRRPAQADEWLVSAHKTLVERRDPPYLLSLLLMSASPDRGLHLLGVPALTGVAQ